MLVLNPARVTFDGKAWADVRSVSVSRSAQRTIVEHGEGGVFPVFVDVTEVRIGVEVVQALGEEDADALLPGEAGTLRFETRPGGGDANGRRVSVSCVVTGVSYEVSGGGANRRRVRLVAVSDAGDEDPVSVVSL